MRGFLSILGGFDKLPEVRKITRGEEISRNSERYIFGFLARGVLSKFLRQRTSSKTLLSVFHSGILRTVA